MSAASEVVAIIPARLGSTRLPGKVLLAETGKPLIQHVWEGVRAAKSVSRVVVATDDQRVASAVRTFGGDCVLTREDHPNGTSRLCEAAEKLGLGDDHIIVNVQGDEPEIEAETIQQVVQALIRGEHTAKGAAMGTVATPFGAGENPSDPNCVKVVCDHEGAALYFSRSLIPFDRDGRAGPDASPLRHVGIYSYRTAFLKRYVSLPTASIERAEQLEQLRAVYHGYRIMAAIRPAGSARIGIDTREQYSAFVERTRARGAVKEV